MHLVYQSIEKSPLFVLLFFDVAAAVIAVKLSQVADPIVPVAIRRFQSLITVI
jgi:hypothetical protein